MTARHSARAAERLCLYNVPADEVAFLVAVRNVNIWNAPIFSALSLGQCTNRWSNSMRVTLISCAAGLSLLMTSAAFAQITGGVTRPGAPISPPAVAPLAATPPAPTATPAATDTSKDAQDVANDTTDARSAKADVTKDRKALQKDRQGLAKDKAADAAADAQGKAATTAP